MTAEVFYREFINRVRPEIIDNGTGDSYFKIYKNLRKFTKLINNNVIAGIIKDYHYESQHEYFRIDTVGWVSQSDSIRSEAMEIRLNPHLWNLKIAVEHENSVKDWTDEVTKLIHIKCPLKVIIAYNNCDRRNTDTMKLDHIAGWMKMVDAFSDGEKEEYLVIIGNAAPLNSKNPGYTDFDYRGYIFDRMKGGFKIIENKY